jgi:hypothetical protein
MAFKIGAKSIPSLGEDNDWFTVRISSPGTSSEEAWESAETVSKYLDNVDCAGWYFSIMNGSEGIILKIKDPNLAMQVKLIYGK